MDYIDFLTRLFKKTGGKYFHLILDTIASKVFMSDGTTVESSIESTRTQTAIAIYAANTAQNTANSAYDKAQIAQETADLKLDKSIAASELAGNGMIAKNGKLNIDNNVIRVQFNTRDIIEESGEWEAPVTGTYRITVIGGGNGGNFRTDTNQAWAGLGCGPIIKYKSYTKGQKINVTIGAAGLGYKHLSSAGNEDIINGGKTIFDDIECSTSDGKQCITGDKYMQFNSSGTLVIAVCMGGGMGGGSNKNASNYGAGGGVYYLKDGSINTATNGYQGCVIIEYFDPEKA